MLGIHKWNGHIYLGCQNEWMFFLENSSLCLYKCWVPWNMRIMILEVDVQNIVYSLEITKLLRMLKMWEMCYPLDELE